MYIDHETMFSDKQAITADAASTNVYDTSATKDVGKGEPARLIVQVMEAFNNLTSLDVIFQTATDSAFTSPVNTAVRKSVLLADLALGAVLVDVPLPVGLKRYLRVYYDVTGTAPTTGKVSAFLVLDSQTNR